MKTRKRLTDAQRLLKAVEPLMKPQHTPTPWMFDGSIDGVDLIHDNQGKPVIIGTVDSKADAAYIVRAVNSHEKLLRLARELRDICLNNGTDYKGIDEAIAKAEGKKP